MKNYDQLTTNFNRITLNHVCPVVLVFGPSPLLRVSHVVVGQGVNKLLTIETIMIQYKYR